MINFRWCAIGALGITSMMLTPTLGAWQGNDSGEALFKRQCAGCHGPDGSGKTAMGRSFKMRDLKSEDVQKMHDSELNNIIAKGKGKMPAYGSRLKEEQIESLVRYIRQLAKNK